MSQLINLEAAILTLAIVAFAWAAHNRFTQKVADTAPGLLAAAGLLATIVGLSLAGFDAGEGLLELRREVGVALLASAVGLASALSIKVRYAVFGIPAALVIDPGPSNRDLLGILERQLSLQEQNSRALQHFQEMTIGNAPGSLLTNLGRLRTEHGHRLDALRESLGVVSSEQTGIAAQASAQQERLHEALAQLSRDQTGSGNRILAQADRLRDSFGAFAEKQAAHNLAMTIGLKEVIEDFSSRIGSQFRDNLAKLEEAVGTTVALQTKHCAQVTEMMHHERRSADHMNRTTDAFQLLVERSTTLAAVSDQLQRSADLLGPRQEAITASLAELASNSKIANDAMSKRLTELRSELEESIQHNGDKIRRQMSDDSTKAKQQATSCSKELEALSKTSGSHAQQLTALSSKFGSDLGGLAQQLKKLLELSKTARA